ncbi:meiosis inhibitor protein 1-like [Xenopus laevis]|uniref:Meiosis inhibitor protein 1-like n=1 Tax=Xenopus laevis TaxID=8355 RepID=A0A8J1MXQ4_XENLA|nr:meiosis inhibitor protein 1-like [Xenopus laevis]
MADLYLYESVHYRHHPRWLLSGCEERGDGVTCLACVIEMMSDGAVSIIRKKHVLSSFQSILRNYASCVTELLTSHERVCTQFIGTFLGMLQNVEDAAVLDLVTKSLVQLITELHLEQVLHRVLDECEKRLCEVTNLTLSLSLLCFMGKLLDAIPDLADLFAATHYELVEYLTQGMIYPNEVVKAAICYLYGKLYSVPSAAEKLSTHFSDKLCGLFLATLENAQTKELQINCMGLLKQLLKYDHFVSMIMNESDSPGDSESTPTLEAQNPLPVVLKKVLLSREELLQIASAQCIAAILVHSPAKYAPAFIYADIPEFLFENLLSTNEVLIWSLYSCLMLMTEERIFFSKCYSVYGIESVVRSLKNILPKNNIELQKQGLLLLTEILSRQPVQIKLFTNPGIFRLTCDVLQEAVNCPVLEVVIEANRSASAFLRKDHLSIPVQYMEMQNLLSNILHRCADVPLPVIKKKLGHSINRDQTRINTQQGRLLTTALQSFHNACRLAFECQSDPLAQENAFTAPTSQSEETLENFSCFLLKICDQLCIPTVLKYYERTFISASMETFFLILCDLFIIAPSMKEAFSVKLASVSFIRLALKMKASYHFEQRYPNLNQACSDFLCNLCCTLWKLKVESANSLNEVADLLQRHVIHINGTISENICVLLESPNCCTTNRSLRSHQYTLIIIFFIAYVWEDRLVPETDLFLAVLGFLNSTQSIGDILSPCVIKAAIYLLAVCQDKNQAMSESAAIGICRMLESIGNLQLIYFQHPLFFKFFFCYPQLMEMFGQRIAELYISMLDCSQISELDKYHQVCNHTSTKACNVCNLSPLMNILESNPKALLILLVCITYKL